MSIQGGIAGYPPSPYIVNLIELQNTVNNASGLTPTSVLSNAVTDIQKMVDFQKKQINTNFLASYDSNAITVLSNLNLSNASLTIDGTSVTATSASGVTFLSTGNTSIILSATSSPAITFNVQRSSFFTLSQQGTTSFLSTVTCFGNILASNFVTLSDSNYKHQIQNLGYSFSQSTLSNLQGVRFVWNQTNQPDIGFLAQQTQSILPEAVHETEQGLSVSYTKVIPLLVESVKGLTERVAVLEKEIAALKQQAS